MKINVIMLSFNNKFIILEITLPLHNIIFATPVITFYILSLIFYPVFNFYEMIKNNLNVLEYFF